MHAMSLLDEVKAEELQTFTHLCTVRLHDSLTAALNVLKEANILSAPVQGEDGKYVGLIDMTDIVAFVVEGIKERQDQDDHHHLGIGGLLEQRERFSQATVAEVVDFSKKNPYMPLPEGSTVRQVIQHMMHNRLHRVPIVNGQEGIQNLVTQSGIIAFLSANVTKLGDIANKTVEELNLGTHPVIAIHANKTAMEAFQLMHEAKVSAVAVVDDQHRLIANIGVKDFRTLVKGGESFFGLLKLNIRQFLVKMHENEIDIINPGICCSNKAKVAVVVGKLAVTRIHRIYIVDNHDTPTHVVSLFDVLKVFADA